MMSLNQFYSYPHTTAATIANMANTEHIVYNKKIQSTLTLTITLTELWKDQDEKIDHDRENDPTTDKKKKKCQFLCGLITLFICVHPQCNQHTKQIIYIGLYYNCTTIDLIVSTKTFTETSLQKSVKISRTK